MDEKFVSDLKERMEFVFVYQERRIWHFHRYIDELIGPDAVPEALRVPDRISHYIEA